MGLTITQESLGNILDATMSQGDSERHREISLIHSAAKEYVLVGVRITSQIETGC